MNRRYYDLIPPGDDATQIDTTFSFARTMAALGFVVASVDYLGLGDSSKPHDGWLCTPDTLTAINRRSEEHTSELQSLMRISYAVFCLKKNKTKYYRSSTQYM